ncbi:hypothetical protein, partial [Mesorhizobium sp.]|uniref:hypothetical protein n=1 Tax=Mesorhizobium sp. TaxID=1871066 RepID=UPI0025EA9465
MRTFLELLEQPRRTMTCASLQVKKRANQSRCKWSRPPLNSRVFAANCVHSTSASRVSPIRDDPATR